MTSKSESPAPPKCEACDNIRGQYLVEEDWERLMLSNHHSLYAVAQLGLGILNAALAAKLAEIAELRALVGPFMNEADWHMEACDCAGCVWFEKARAALAPKVSHE